VHNQKRALTHGRDHPF